MSRDHPATYYSRSVAADIRRIEQIAAEPGAGDFAGFAEAMAEALEIAIQDVATKIERGHKTPNGKRGIIVTYWAEGDD